MFIKTCVSFIIVSEVVNNTQSISNRLDSITFCKCTGILVDIQFVRVVWTRFKTKLET